MTRLLDLWVTEKAFFESKTIEQVLKISGDGNLKDGTESSIQLRELIANLPASDIERYINECLCRPFQQSGLVLQDLINEVGHRLGFSIQHGFYRGGRDKIGFDGIWTTKDGYSFVIEVRTTDTYQFNLDTQAKYRKRLIGEGRIKEDKSSILLVIGRIDTGGLEAQTRGSRHAWDIRIIGVDALLKLMKVKENVSSIDTVNKIQEVLKPLEYTRVDRLIDIIFTTSEDMQSDENNDDHYIENDTNIDQRQTIPVKYHDECIKRIAGYIRFPLIKQGRCSYTTADQSIRVLCIISKEYERGGISRYWFSFHPSQEEFLSGGTTSLIALGCGSSNTILIIPFNEFQKQLSSMRTTDSGDRKYWHVEVFRKGDQFLLTKSDSDGWEITKFKL